MYPLHKGSGSLGGKVRRDTLAMNFVSNVINICQVRVQQPGSAHYHACSPMRKLPATISESAGTYIDAPCMLSRSNAYSETIADATSGSNRTAEWKPRSPFRGSSFLPVMS